jgi:hypothetical protein
MKYMFGCLGFCLELLCAKETHNLLTSAVERFRKWQNLTQENLIANLQCSMAYGYSSASNQGKG